MTRRQELQKLVRRIPLFWKVLVLVLVVAGIPLGIAISTSLTAAATTAESLISKNLLQLSDRVAERLSYTMVSIEGDLEVLENVSRNGDAYKAFALAQRRELFGNEGEERKRFAAPKYLEVAWYNVDGSPRTLIYKDEVVENGGVDWRQRTWCQQEDFVQEALASPDKVLVSGLIGCSINDRSYEPGEGLLGKRFDGGVRVSTAVRNKAGEVEGVASLVLAELHLTWALLSLEEKTKGEGLWAMVVNEEGHVISHPDPSRIWSQDKGKTVAESWNVEGALSLSSFVASDPLESLESLLKDSREGLPRTGMVETGEEERWMVAVQPLTAEFGQYTSSTPFASVWVFYPRAGVIAEWLRLAIQYAILLGITAIVALIGSVLLARNLSKPIQRLAVAAGEIAKGEEPELPSLSRGDEVGELARAFVQMQEDIHVHQTALMRSERLAAVGTFVAGIVHETKNVLAGIGNYLTLLDRRFKDDPIREQVVAPMRRALDQLDTLTLRMRELALTPRFTTTELNEVLRHALELVEHQAKEEQINVTTSFEQSVYLEKADGSLLGQVFLNLILNAIQACPREGEISIGLTYNNGRACVRIQDSGEGFPVDQMDEILKPFVTTKAGGTGLGLYISRSIVLRHGGDLAISNHPDGGAVVEVTLSQATSEPTAQSVSS